MTLDFLSRNDASPVPKIPQIGVKEYLTVSIPIQNFATIPLGFPEPSILIKRKQDFLVEVKYAKMNLCDLKVILDPRKNSFPGNFQFTEF